MSRTIAVVAAGAMGAAVGARLAARGARVVTSLDGRSEASIVRARAAGMIGVGDAELAGAEIFLSIVPPDKAVGLATRMAAAIAAARTRPVYVDLNAVSPATAREVGAIVAAAGATFVDGGIFGAPPQREGKGPAFHLCGPVGDCAAILAGHGLDAKVLEGGVGAASALKMAYAGITKGLTALGAGMILAATRHGVGGALLDELGASQPELLARLAKGIPDMLPKAYRWVPEMREIAATIGEDRPESAVYTAMAEFYAAVAADHAGEERETALLMRFFAGRG
ncbi:DUF1932 domain-containing protein [Labrys wisconsinensis]|uniref:3-hydroxyisobutyrate dehydrogenase-like beta-hydroxyacid dehydrogenase n=1 Tax=Labrys wisconsinensis TaxID=425677 RepID=A0ABU0JDJ5_9HYPH|nr:NAD(P)-dependent oxidoreductase [Labrys wisconsinensis]MDQ0471690.1 3-hydroxyisobutyrate dehydrogenase-like beta-hydroxyacid dehydrogenase [Labrys wisconsinensis]